MNKATRAAELLRPRLERVWFQARPILGIVRPLGWIVLTTAFLSWLFGVWLGWVELLTMATICAVLIILCVPFLFGKRALDIGLEVLPGRVTVGERAAGQLMVVNRSASHLLPTKVEVVVGAATATFDIPSLSRDVEHEELFQISTERRGIIPVGPAKLVRADPVGLFARVVSQSDPVHLYVHPVILRVPGVGPGFLRDLEGVESAELSPSDLAFHSLREYVPGDDRRHVHWKTSARSGRLMVQQFVDTRRSHVLLLLDDDSSRYAEPDDFETAVSIVGTLGTRAIDDEQMRTVIVGRRPVPAMTRNALLDALSGVENAGPSDALDRCMALASRSARNASIVFLVTGSTATLTDIRRVSRRFTLDVRIVAIRVGVANPAVQRIANVLIFDLDSLDELPGITNVAVKL